MVGLEEVKLWKSARGMRRGSHEFVSCREGTEGAGSVEGAEEAGTRGLVGMGKKRGRRKRLALAAAGRKAMLSRW